MSIIYESHIIDQIKSLPKFLIFEIIIVILIINFIFGVSYYLIYLYDNKSFININNNKKLSLNDYIYYSLSTFFSLGYDITPQSNFAKFLSGIQLMISFVITTLFIAKIIK